MEFYFVHGALSSSPRLSPIESLRIGQRYSTPDASNHSLYHRKHFYKFQLFLGKLRREPERRWFDWYFAPKRSSHKRVARQQCYGPPPEFPLASSWPRLDHTSFGSYDLCSERTERHIDLPFPGCATLSSFQPCFTFITLTGFLSPQLAQFVHSFNRVSRRV